MGAPGEGWGLALLNSERHFLNRIAVTNDQKVLIQPVKAPQMDQGITAGPFFAPQLKKDHSFNKLVVMLRGSKLKIFANGQSVCEPLTLPGVDSVTIKGLVSGDAGNSIAEFERIAIFALPQSEARSEEFARTLSNGDTTTGASPPASPKQWQTDREVAEWVLSWGGSVAVTPAANRFDFPEYVKDVAKLPAEPFPLVGIDFLANSRVSDRDMARIEPLRNLLYLSCENTTLGDETLVHAAPRSILRVSEHDEHQGHGCRPGLSKEIASSHLPKPHKCAYHGCRNRPGLPSAEPRVFVRNRPWNYGCHRR